MTRLWRPRMLVLALLLSLGSSSFADGQESIRHSFQSLAGQVVAEFQRATDGIRKPHFDIRRRDTFPDVNAEMVGMLGGALAVFFAHVDAGLEKRLTEAL